MNLLRQQLFGSLIGLSRASESKEILESSGHALIQGLKLAYDPVWDLANTELSIDFRTSVESAIESLHKEKSLMAPDCAACQYPCGRTADYDMAETLESSESLRNAKLHLLALLGQIAIHTKTQDVKPNGQFLSDALFQISCTYETGQLKDLILQAETNGFF